MLTKAIVSGTKIAAATSSQIAAKRGMSVVSGPPSVRLPLAEKAVHGLAIAAGILSVPVYILVNIKNYRGGWEN